MKTLPLNEVRDDGGTQSRVSINDEVVAEYAEAIDRGDRLPAVVVFYDGATYWLADGFHRLRAHKKAKQLTIEVDVRQGDRRDAVWFAIGANREHGLRRGPGDVKNAILTVIRDEEWTTKPDTEIAKHIGCSQQYVSKLRAADPSYNSSKTREVTRGGKTYQQDTTNIGKRQDQRDRSMRAARAKERLDTSTAQEALDDFTAPSDAPPRKPVSPDGPALTKHVQLSTSPSSSAQRLIDEYGEEWCRALVVNLDTLLQQAAE